MMNAFNLQWIVVVFLSYLLTLILIPASMKLGRFMNAVDNPGALKIHNAPTPRTGGVAVFSSVFVILLLCPLLTESLPWQVKTLLGFAFLALFLVGCVDDIKTLPPHIKLPVHMFSSFVAVVGLNVGYEMNALHSIFIFLFILMYINSFNLIDGMDGLAGGLAFIIAIAISTVALFMSNSMVQLLSLLLASSVAAFLVFNVNPAKLFLGDCGSTGLGFSLAVLISMLWVQSETHHIWVPLLFIVSLPLMDTVSVILKRLIRHQSVFAGDRSHLYDTLLQRGLSIRQTLLLFYAGAIVVAAAGIYIFWVQFSRIPS